MRNRLTLLFALSFVSIACGGATLTGADSDALSRSSSPNQGGKIPPTNTCGPAGPRHTFTSIADVQASLAGRWALCSGAINSPQDARGIEFDGKKAYFLVQSTGGLTRGGGPGYVRDVSILDTSSMNGPNSYQINLDGQGFGNSYFASYADSTGSLRLDEGTSAKQANYGRIAAPPQTCAGVCGSSGAARAFASTADVASALAGRWSLCSGKMNAPSDAVGIEFTGDRAWFLVDDGAGNLARGVGFDYEAKFEVLDTSSMNGPGSYQVNLTRSGGNSYVVEVSDCPRKLVMNEGTSGNRAEYAGD